MTTSKTHNTLAYALENCIVKDNGVTIPVYLPEQAKQELAMMFIKAGGKFNHKSKAWEFRKADYNDVITWIDTIINENNEDCRDCNL